MTTNAPTALMSTGLMRPADVAAELDHSCTWDVRPRRAPGQLGQLGAITWVGSASVRPFRPGSTTDRYQRGAVHVYTDQNGSDDPVQTMRTLLRKVRIAQASRQPA